MLIPVGQIEWFALVFIRVVSAFAVLPVFGHSALPVMARAGLAAATTLLLLPVLPPPLPASSGTVLDFFGLALRETACGVLLGLAGQMLFYGVEVAGQLIGFQSGFSMVASIDPNTETQTTFITQIYNLLALLLFLTLNGHHVVLQGLADSFRAIPVGTLHPSGNFAAWLLGAAQHVLADGIRIAAPIMVTLLLTDVGLGILSRIAPALNIFVLGFPLKIAVTVVLVALTLGIVSAIFSRQFGEFVRGWPDFVRLLGVS